MNKSELEKLDQDGKNKAFMSAIREGKSLTEIKKIKDSGADVNAQDFLDQRPLLVALNMRGVAGSNLVEYLLNNGADPRLAGSSGVTALAVAARGVSIKNITAIMDKLDELGALNVEDLTAAGRIATDSSAKILELIIGRGADANRIGASDDSAVGVKSVIERAVDLESKDGAKAAQTGIKRLGSAAANHPPGWKR